jgi:hypothetical protein
VGLTKAHESLDGAHERRIAQDKHDLLHKIRDFFGLSDERPEEFMPDLTVAEKAEIKEELA